MTAPRAQEPLPCPFCGAKPQPFAAVHWECPFEDCAGHSLFATLEEWNRRAPSADTRRLDWLEKRVLAGDDVALGADEDDTTRLTLGMVTEVQMRTLVLEGQLSLRSAIDAAMTQEGE